MTRSVFKACQTRRMAAICLFALSVLILVSSSRPWASSKVSSASKPVSTSDSNSSAFTTVSTGKYTLNQYIYPGSTTFTGLSPTLNPSLPQISSWSIGVPVLYVITIGNSDQNQISPVDITLKDDLASSLGSNFVVLNVKCDADVANLAACPNPANLPQANAPLSWTIPHIMIKVGGSNDIVIRVLGYYTAPNSYQNTFSVFETGQQQTTEEQGPAKNLQITNNWSVIDLALTKTSSTTSTSLSATSAATIHYKLTLKGDSSEDFYPGNALSIQDSLVASYPPLPSYSIPSPSVQISSLNGSTLPTGPTPLTPTASPFGANSYAGTYLNWPSGSVIKKGDTVTIEFDVEVKTPSLCGDPSIAIQNKAVIVMNGFTYSDSNNSNHTPVTAPADSFTTGLQPCVAPGTIAKARVCPSAGCPLVNWGDTVTYRIDVKNNMNTPQTFQVRDSVSKQSITVPLRATLRPNSVAADVHCSPPTVCSTTPAAILPVDVLADSQGYQLFQTDFTLQPNGNTGDSVALTFDVRIDKLADCQTDPGNVFNNTGYLYQAVTQGSITSYPYIAGSSVTVNLPNLPLCKLKVTKVLDQPTNGIAFGQPVSYTITYENQDSQPMTVRTLRDELNMRDTINSNPYGDIPITNLAASCTSTGGVSPMPIYQLGWIKISPASPDWEGNVVIQEAAGGMTFPGGAKLQCTVSFTPHEPSATDSYCKGTGLPEIVNNAFMDLSGLDYWGVKPSAPYFAQATAPLPLCRKVSVLKSVKNGVASTGPNGLLTFQIDVTNYSNDPVSNFQLTDQLPTGFTFVTGSLNCAACTGPGFTGNNLNENFIPIPGTSQSPANTVTLTFQVHAPLAGGTYANTATGSFGAGPPGVNFYFEGNPAVLLVNAAQVQVLTPTLAKNFQPNSVAVNGSAVLSFTITNQTSDPAQTGISFTDLLPTGVTVTSAPSTACGGAVSVGGGNAVTLSNAALAQAQHSCQFSVVVKASSCGTLLNDRSNFSKVTNLDVTNAQATLTVTGCPDVKPPTLTKFYEPAKIPLNGTTNLAFTITNSTGDPKQTGIAFSDTLPPGLQIISVVSSGCSGTLTISPDHQTVTLTGGQLVGSNADGSGKHSCQIIVKVKASDHCGVYPNTEKNFSDVKDLDISGINAPLTVACGEDGGGLTVQKDVKGALAGFHGQFNFLVQCSTPNGFYQKAVTVNWPTPGFTTLTDVPAGSQCVVTEGPPPGSLPTNYNWAGLPAYSPNGGVVSIDPKGHVTVTDTMSLCNETGQVTITKVVKGLPKDYIGVFQGTLQCWVSDKLVTYPITLTSPNGLTTTIGNIPLGSACTFQETGQPPLTGGLVWNQPVYSPDFGTVTLTGECCQQITVTNEAHPCCTGQTGGSGSGTGQNYSDTGPALTPTNYGKPTKPAPRGHKNIRKTSP